MSGETGQAGVIDSVKKAVAKSVESQSPSWKNKLSRIFSSSAKARGESHQKTELTEEQKLDFVKGSISMLAHELEEPIRLQVKGKVFWFDGQGDESRGEYNAQRFEEMLKKGEIGTFSDKHDGVNDDIYSVHGTAIRLVGEIQEPIKIDNIWFDIQGAMVSDDNFDRFEKNFGVNQSVDQSEG